MIKIKNWYKNLKFRNKVLLSHLVVSLLPVLVLGIFCYAQTRNMLIQREQEILSETLNQNVTVLNGNLKLYQNYMDNLIWNHNLQQVLNEEYINNFQMYLAYRDVIDPIIMNVKNMDSTVKQVTIYSSNDTLYPHGKNLLPISQMEVRLEELNDYKLHWYVDPEENKIDMYCKKYTKDRERQDVIYMQMDYEQVFSNFTTLFSDHYGVIITDENDKRIFSFYQGMGEETEGAVPDFEDYVVREIQIGETGWKASIYRPLSVILASARNITVLVSFVILFCCLMIAGVSMALTKSVVSPLQSLVKSVNQIEINHLSVEGITESEDEIGHLSLSFKNMVERLDSMINEVYQSKILQQEYEMKALQAQINPHFLYNSLSLINWKAILAGQEDISEMAQLLSTFYRTTLNRGKNITTVKGEWDNTCSYIKIQQMMHSGKFETEMQIEESVLEYEMLNLLLQPLVENAIVHGLDHKTVPGVKKLEVKGWEKGEHLIFTVCDNGCGMSEETMENLLTMESKGYGVQNVHHRVQLYYGNEYGLKYESRTDQGTKAILIIPKRQKQ